MTDIVRRKPESSGFDHLPNANSDGSIKLSLQDYRRRVLGCWIGKSIGGTLGQLYEGMPGPLNLTFYDPVPTKPIPNDDLDLQIVWLQMIRQKGVNFTYEELAQAWLDTVRFEIEEYGVALGNLRRGIFPPFSGQWCNYFGDDMGASIRSEIWAALAPGDPVLACRLAYQDAIVDHDGEGDWGELFFSALESAAFVVHDRDLLIRIGLAAIDPDCKVYQAVVDTLKWFKQSSNWLEIRQKILECYGSNQYTYVPMDIAFVILGWLSGNDFGSIICKTVNCGQDTDCTAASMGAILGIIAPDGFGEEWVKPISNELVVSPTYRHLNPPASLDELADITCSLGKQMLLEKSDLVRITTDETSLPEDLGEFYIKSLQENKIDIQTDLNCVVRQVGNITIRANYPNGLSVKPWDELPLNLTFSNHKDKQSNFKVELEVPPDLKLCKPESCTLDVSFAKKQSVGLIVKTSEKIPMCQSIGLKLTDGSVSATVPLPILSHWPWNIKIAKSLYDLDTAKVQKLWLKERQILPADGIQIPCNGAIRAAIRFATITPKKLCLTLASNSDAKMKIDGDIAMQYTEGAFLGLGEQVVTDDKGQTQTVQVRKVHECEIHQDCYGWVWHELEITAWNFDSNPKLVVWFQDRYTCEHLTGIFFQSIP